MQCPMEASVLFNTLPPSGFPKVDPTAVPEVARANHEGGPGSKGRDGAWGRVTCGGLRGRRRSWLPRDACSHQPTAGDPNRCCPDRVGLGLTPDWVSV